MVFAFEPAADNSFQDGELRGRQGFTERPLLATQKARANEQDGAVNVLAAAGRKGSSIA